ncbi:MAG: preprotein translocase subunit YajC [Gammaproteobacteria bacterium]|nr:preprotein translocase subunit YajC [Gammaproteobacteria bacterium]
MTLLNLLGVSDALAATSANAGANGGLASFLPMIAIFFVGAYFLMIRPQNKRVKAHRKLMSELSKGDEVVTAGGLIGKIAKMTDEFVTISIAENVDINIQKSSIANVLPKGTIKSIE